MTRKNLTLLGAILDKFSSQIEFAEAVKSSEATVSRTLNRHWNLRPEEKEQWAKGLGITVAKLDNLLEA